METRLEHDLLGALEVPADAYYGIHTLRACENFQISKLPIHPELIRQLALEKKLFTKKQLDTILSPIEMTHPGIAGSGSLEQDGGSSNERQHD